MKKILIIENLCVFRQKREVLHDISFTLHEGEAAGMIGISGSGKTTLLRAIMGLLNEKEADVTGRILLQTEEGIINLVHLDEKKFRKIRGAEIGVVFQDAGTYLCPVRTIGSQIIESIKAHQKMSHHEVKIYAYNLFQQFGLDDMDRIWNSYPFELSGGMNQRIAVIMAIMNRPRILLADEATSALDSIAAKKVIDALKMGNQKYGTSLFFISHDISAAEALCHDLYVLEKGRIVEWENTEDIMKAPSDPYTQNLIASFPRLKQYE